MQHEPPRLSVEDAAKFLAGCFTNEYRAKCIAHFREIHGAEYAEAVRQRTWAMIKSKEKQTK